MEIEQKQTEVADASRIMEIDGPCNRLTEEITELDDTEMDDGKTDKAGFKMASMLTSILSRGSFEHIPMIPSIIIEALTRLLKYLAIGQYNWLMVDGNEDLTYIQEQETHWWMKQIGPVLRECIQTENSIKLGSTYKEKDPAFHIIISTTICLLDILTTHELRTGVLTVLNDLRVIKNAWICLHKGHKRQIYDTVNKLFFDLSFHKNPIYMDEYSIFVMELKHSNLSVNSIPASQKIELFKPFDDEQQRQLELEEAYKKRKK